MRIKKTSETTPTMASIVDGYSTSTQDGYSCKYANEHYGGVVLYENTTGTDSEITLSDNYSNYSYIEVYYGWWADNKFGYGQTMSKIDLASSTRIILTYNLSNQGWFTDVYESWDFNNSNKLTPYEKRQHSQSGYSANTQTRIAKVIGYK